MIPVFRKAFRDSVRTMLWTSVGLAAFIFLTVAFYPALIEDADALNDIISSYPPEMMALMGVSDVENYDLTAPGNYIEIQFSVWMVLILAGVIIVQGFNAMTNAERDGSADLLLSLPISRRDYLLGRMLNSLATVLIVLTASWLALVASSLIWPAFDPTPIALARGMYGAFFPLAVVIGVVYLLVATVPSSKRFAGGIVYTFVFGGYIVYGLSQAVSDLEAIQPFFIYNYYNSAELIDQGLTLSNWVIMSVVAAILLGAAWFFIDRKELGV